MKKLLIISGKGGTGKTTVAAAFIEFLKARAYADCDVDAPNLHIVACPGGKPESRAFYGSQKACVSAEKCTGCGLCAEKCRFGAVRMKEGRAEIDEYACEGCGVCELVCAAGAVSMKDDEAGRLLLYRGERVFSGAELRIGRGNSGMLVTEVKKAMCAASDAALAVIDGSPGIGCPVIASVTGTDLALIVAEPTVSGIHDLRRVAETARILGVKTAVCVNRYDICPENTGKILEFCRERSIPAAGMIPFDPAVPAAADAGRSIASFGCPASEAVKETLDRVLELLGEQSGAEPRQYEAPPHTR